MSTPHRPGADLTGMRPRVRATAAEEQVIRDAHRALEARGRGKGGIHTTTEAYRVIRSLLDVGAGRRMDRQPPLRQGQRRHQ